jgi:predicted homoserine dehydrogenase-like protein
LVVSEAAVAESADAAGLEVSAVSKSSAFVESSAAAAAAAGSMPLTTSTAASALTRAISAKVIKVTRDDFILVW